MAGELARRVHAAGAAVLYGRCVEQVLVPYQPWVEALEGLLGDLPPDEAEHWLTVHDGALARLLPARGGEGAPEHGARARYLAFESVRGLLEHAAAARPVLLVLDDLHWVDADSAALLRHLARLAGAGAAAGARAGARAGAERRRRRDARGAAARRTAAARGRWPGSTTRRSPSLLARHGASTPPRRSRYRERTGGNPFFLEELLRDERERDGAAEGPPAGVRDVVDRRLARLTDAAREVLALAATVGLRFDLKGLAAAGDWPSDALLDALDEAVAAGLVVERRGRSLRLRARARGRGDRRRPARLATRAAASSAGRRARGVGRSPRRVSSRRTSRRPGPLAPADRVVRWSRGGRTRGHRGAGARRRRRAPRGRAGRRPLRLPSAPSCSSRWGTRTIARASATPPAPASPRPPRWPAPPATRRCCRGRAWGSRAWPSSSPHPTRS